MKLSEAIRIGASWSPKIKRYFKTNKGTCAIGAALEGCFGTLRLSNSAFPDFKSLEYKKLASKFPYLNLTVKHPVCNFQTSLCSSIWSLNDEHDWTREQMADWIEKLENENDWTGTKEVKKKEVNEKTYEKV